MKLLLTSFSLAFAIGASAQEMLINKTDGSVIQKLSLMELHQASHVPGSENSQQIQVELRNGATYTCDISDIDHVSILTKDDMLRQGRYGNMSLVKDFGSIQELNEGDLVGIIDEADYDYDGFVADAYSALDGTSTSPIVSNVDPETIETLAKVLDVAFKANLSRVSVTSGVPVNRIRFHVTNIVYVGKDIDGTKIPLSARLIYPYSTGNRSLPISKIFVEQHTTLFEDYSEPSASFYPFSCSGVVFQGYMVAQPDLLGFGISSMRSQLFVHRELNGAACADLIMATQQYVELSNSHNAYIPVPLTDDASIVSAGSSQGASTALGFTYYMENELPDEVAAQLPKVSETRLCAGAFQPQRMFEELAHCDSLSGFLVPVMAATAAVACPDYMRYDDGRPILPYEFLNPALREMTWEGMQDQGIPEHMTIWQMLNSMYGSSTVFAAMFRRDFPYSPNPQFASFRKMVAEGVIRQDAEGNNVLNYEDPRVIALTRYFADNNLTDPALWVPRSDISLLHSVNDATVPFVNSQIFYDNMAEAMAAEGHTLSFTPYDNPSNMSHVMICLIWMIAQVTGLPVTTVLELLASM